MREKDIEYYQARAEQELELAQRAKHQSAARAHSILAGHYLDLIYNSDPAPERPIAPVWH